MKTGKEISLFPGRCQSVSFSPDGCFLANGGGRFGTIGKFSGKVLQLWEVATGRKVLLTDALSSASVLRFSENGKILTSVDVWGNIIRKLDVETGESTVQNFENRSEKRITLPEPYALTHDKFAIGGKRSKIELWDVTTGKMLPIFDEIGKDKHVIALGIFSRWYAPRQCKQEHKWKHKDKQCDYGIPPATINQSFSETFFENKQVGQMYWLSLQMEKCSSAGAPIRRCGCGIPPLEGFLGG